MTRLSVSGITKRFGGITATRDVSFDVAPGELVGIIGPNGSGKSTLFEVISGFYRPDAGEVRLDGARLTGLAPDRVCRLGVARTFQKLRPFAGLSVVDNVMIGALCVGWVTWAGLSTAIVLDADDPGMPLMLAIMLLAGAVFILILVVMRALLGKATTMHADLEGVI